MRAARLDPERLLRVYEAVRVLKRASSKRVSELLGIPLRSVQRYLAILVESGFIERVRDGRSVLYVARKPMTMDDAVRIARGAKEEERDAAPYVVARRIAALARETGLVADLIGAAKIHLSVPDHQRVTHDVDVVVVPEHAKALVTVLRYGLGATIERVGGTHCDYRLLHGETGTRIDVVAGAFREEGRVVWDVSDLLRRYGGATLELAVVAKLSRRSFRDDDAYDVAIAAPHIDPGRFAEAAAHLASQSPELIERVARHLVATEDFCRREFGRIEAEIRAGALRRLASIAADLRSPRRDSMTV